MTSAPGKHTCGLGRILAMDRGEKAGRLACQTMRCSPADLMFDGGPSMHASCSRGASLCRQATTSTRLSTAVSLFDQAPAPPCTRSYLGSCSSGNDELARPSQAADDAARSERVCQCSRRSRTFTLEQRGCQGCGCICVVAIDVLGQLSMAMWQARLVGTAAWWCGRSWAS